MLEPEFISNIEASHFTLCDRGAGNFSIRFYQVLACGRIPALVDTGMMLPFENEIPWKSLVVWGKNAKDLANNIIDFYNSHDIVEAQQACSSIFARRLSAEAFASVLQNHLSAIVTRRGGRDPASVT